MQTNRRLAAVFAGFGLGVAGVLAGIMIWNSRVVVGIAIACIMGVFLVAMRLFRCPLCGAAVFLSPVSQSLTWITGRSRRCPRCRADFEEAIAATSGSSGKSR
jgi:hypothetical protein